MYEKGKRYTNKLYTTIRANGGWANYSMIELEKQPCNDANEACAKEREYYDTLNSGLNTQHPNRSDAEWSFDNKEKTKEQRQKYREINKEKIKQRTTRAENVGMSSNSMEKHDIAEVNFIPTI